MPLLTHAGPLRSAMPFLGDIVMDGGRVGHRAASAMAVGAEVGASLQTCDTAPRLCAGAVGSSL